MLPRRRPLVIHDPRRHEKSRAIADLLAVIGAAIDHDNVGEVEPGSIDTHGLTVLVDGILYRLELTDEERLYPSREAWESTPDSAPDADRDWMSDTDMPF